MILGSKEVVLVDAGLPGTERQVDRLLRRNRLSFGDINLIVITHAHVDHAGNAARLRQLSGARIVAHRADAPHYRREAPMTYCPTGPVGSLFLRTGIPGQPYTAFEPDILLDDGEVFDLVPFGLDGTVRSTPGHTKGSISVELDTKEALVGDLVASGILIGGVMLTGRAKRPPFEDDPIAVSKALRQIIRRGSEVFFMGHGGPLKANAVARHARALCKLGQ